MSHRAQAPLRRVHANDRRQAALYSVASNVVTSVNNLALALSVQATGGTRSLGAFSLVIAPLYVATAIQRGVTSQSYLTRQGGSDRRFSAEHLIAAGCALVTLAIALAAGTDARRFVLLVLFAPLALRRDAFRYRCFGAQRPQLALATDVAWLSVLAVGCLVGAVASDLTPTAVVALWGLGAIAALGVSRVVAPEFESGTARSGDGVLQPTGKSAASPGALLLESTGVLLLAQGLTFGLAAVSSLEAVGEFRLIQTMLSAQWLIGNALIASVMPSKTVDATAHLHSRTARLKLGALTGAGGLLITAGFVLVPAAVLNRLNVARSDEFVISLLLGSAAITLSTCSQYQSLLVRGLMKPTRWLPRRLAVAAVEPGLGLALASQWGTIGAFTGYLAHQLVLCVILLPSQTRGDDLGPNRLRAEQRGSRSFPPRT